MLEYYLILFTLVVGFPLLLAYVPSSHRSTAFYLYISMLLFSISFSSSLISFPLTDSINISATTIAYSALILATVIFLLIENDIEALRNIIRLIMLMAFIRLMFIILFSHANQYQSLLDAFNLSSTLIPFLSFNILLNSLLTIFALLIIFALFRFINARSRKHHVLSFFYALGFCAVLTLINISAQSILSQASPDIPSLVTAHYQGVIILTLFVSFFFLLFLLTLKHKVAKFHTHPFPLRNIFVPSEKERLLDAKTPSFSLKQSKVMYQELTESIRDVFFTLDKNLVVTYWNKAAEATGVTQEEAIGKSFLELFPNTDETGEEYYYKQVIDSQQEIDFVIKQVNKYNEVSYKKIRAYPSHSGLSVLASDITEQLQTEKEQKQLEEQLQHVQKMDALGTLAGGIAHDFNNILAVIRGYTELCQIEVEAGSSMQDKLERVHQASGRAEELVKQILTFSRMDSSEMRIMKPTTVIHEAVSFLQPIIAANIEIKTSIEDEQVLIKADTNQLHQVFINLGTNASHAMEEQGGKLEFITHTIDFADAPLAQNPDRNSPFKYCLKIDIKDNGVGISPAEQKRILDPFYTTKKSDKGTGLGLSIVDRIVSRHHGKIVINSEVGQGTCISLYFPIWNKAELKVDSTNNSPDTNIKGSGHILLIEDEAALLNLYQNYLQDQGYTVTSCEDAETGLTEFLSPERHFDLVFTNLSLPGKSGIELAREIHQLQPKIPVILSSGNNHLLTSAASEAAIKEYLIKPIRLEALHETLSRHLHITDK